MVLANSQGCLSIGGGVMTRARLDPGLQVQVGQRKSRLRFRFPGQQELRLCEGYPGTMRPGLRQSKSPLRPPPHNFCRRDPRGRQIWILRFPRGTGPVPPGRKFAVLLEFRRSPSTVPPTS